MLAQCLPPMITQLQSAPQQYSRAVLLHGRDQPPRANSPAACADLWQVVVSRSPADLARNNIPASSLLFGDPRHGLLVQDRHPGLVD